MNKVIVIGSGIGGLATAARLVSKGYDVTIFESSNHTGGKIHSFDLDNYRFDAGPSLFTLPNLVDELFLLNDENPREYFNYKKKEIHCKYFWNDGTKINAFSDIARFLKEVKDKLNVSQDTLLKYLKRSQKKYELTEPIFLKKSLHKLSSYFSKNTLKALFHLRIFDFNKSLNETNKKYLKEPHLVQLYNRYATYNGSNPYETSGIMTLIQHLESHYGTWVPNGGMVQISSSITDLIKSKGVKIRLNSNVDQIIVKNKQVKGIISNGQVFTSNYVVSNMDIFFTYKKLLKEFDMPKRVSKSERSSSALIFYWGVKRSFPQLDLHNILFSDDYRDEFESIFKNREVSNDPTIYINITSKDVPNDAPKNCENWFVMINAPYDSEQSWKDITLSLRKIIIQKINAILKTDIEKYIQAEKIYTPQTIETKTQSYKGALYGTSSNSMLSAFLRHPNFSKNIKNLYFCGGSVHPGGGIPLCLLSAKIVSDQFKGISNAK